MSYWLVGGKNDDLLRKNGVGGGKKGGKEEIFTVLWGKIIILEKRGGAKI